MPHLTHNELTLLLLQMLVIVALSKTLAVASRRISQPTVIAEVVAGILLGPSLLGWLSPSLMGFLFPAKSLLLLKSFSQFGLVLFMFLVGLEFNPRLLKGRSHTSIAISHSSIALPFLLGSGLALLLYRTHASPGVSRIPFALFFGIAMSVTAFPVLARILSERNLLTSRIGSIAIACAAVDDVTAWCLLAFVVAITNARAVSDAIWTTGFAVGYIALMLFVARPFARRLGRRVVGPEGLTPTVALACLMMLLISAEITELIGIHTLFGAFLFGAILPKEGALAHLLTEKLELVATTVLLPLFFAYSGLRTEIGLLSSPREWALTAVIVLIATVGKFGGSALAAKFTGLRWRESSAIGILMNTRGLMELVVLNIGLDIGVLTPQVFTMMIVMALVTTFITTPVLSWVYPDSELQRERLTFGDGATPENGFGVLLCVSNERSGSAMAIIANALVASERSRASVTALHLESPNNFGSNQSVPKRDRRSALDELLKKAGQLALEVRALSFVSAEPAKDICRTAAAQKASLVMLGPHKPLFIEGRLGGAVRDVIDESPSTVAVLMERGLTKLERVLVAFAGDEDGEALRVARRLGLAPGVSLTLLQVASQQSAGGRSHLPMDASPTDAAIAEAARGYDLVVLGMTSAWGLSPTGLTLRRERILTECPVSVLIVQPARQPHAKHVEDPSALQRGASLSPAT